MKLPGWNFAAAPGQVTLTLRAKFGAKIVGVKIAEVSRYSDKLVRLIG